MTVVEICRRAADGEIEVIARVSVPVAGCVGIEPLGAGDLDLVMSMLQHVGVVDRRGAELQLSDGERYLHALPQSLRGSRLWAEVVRRRQAELGPL